MSETSPPGLFPLRCTLGHSQSCTTRTRPQVNERNPRYTFPHSWVVYGHPVETSEPYPRNYMKVCLSTTPLLPPSYQGVAMVSRLFPNIRCCLQCIVRRLSILLLLLPITLKHLKQIPNFSFRNQCRETNTAGNKKNLSSIFHNSGQV